MNFTITKDEIVSMQSSLNALNVTLSDNQIIRDLIKCRLHRGYFSPSPEIGGLAIPHPIH